MSYKIFEIDPYLKPYEKDINLRINSCAKKRAEILKDKPSLSEFADAYEYFGFHKTKNGWVYREWAPGADNLYLVGDHNGWNKDLGKMTKSKEGEFEIFIEGKSTLFDGCNVKVLVEKEGELLDRVPLFINRVVQNEYGAWCGQIDDQEEYKWKNAKPQKLQNLFIYECHIGMACEKEGIGTYQEFTKNVLPRIKKQGYNVVQIMAIMEHPYYGSFGYQVSNFFAPSSRYGKSNGLKELIDTAHGMGISVLLDVVHSHAVKNTVEGINEFDGTPYQFFHEGERGNHPAWDTKLFDYNKNGVLRFLLSNLKFWLKEFRFDGFRFDGVTSMIYLDHGLGTAFTDYGKYFSPNTDIEALTYLTLANELIREIDKDAITIAEDMSAMPGMCLPIADGGIGFDYRLAMGAPDLWIKLIKEVRDEDWNMWTLWGELTSRRPKEKYVGYAESHDQALVGDKTIIFRLIDSLMYTDMSKDSKNAIVDRGIALHKLIRLITLSLGGEGYLNFMGNEFGHPEWIDFPREGNGWSHFYCRRQWSLVDNKNLKYEWLNNFDKEMISFAKSSKIFDGAPKSIFIDNEKKVLVYERRGKVFALNFHPTNSYEDYKICPTVKGKYKVILSTDEKQFGGWDRVSKTYEYQSKGKNDGFKIYLPARCGVVLKRIVK